MDARWKATMALVLLKLAHWAVVVLFVIGGTWVLHDDFGVSTWFAAIMLLAILAFVIWCERHEHPGQLRVFLMPWNHYLKHPPPSRFRPSAPPEQTVLQRKPREKPDPWLS